LVKSSAAGILIKEKGIPREDDKNLSSLISDS